MGRMEASATRDKRTCMFTAKSSAHECWPLVMSKFIARDGKPNQLTIGAEVCTMAIHINDGSTLLMRATNVSPGNLLEALQITLVRTDHATSGFAMVSLEVVATTGASGMATAFESVSEALRSALGDGVLGAGSVRADTPPTGVTVA